MSFFFCVLFFKGVIEGVFVGGRLYVQCKGGTTKSAFEGWKLKQDA